MKWLRQVKQDTWLPYLMPWAWKAILFGAFAVGMGIGVVLAVWTLALRGQV